MARRFVVRWTAFILACAVLLLILSRRNPRLQSSSFPATASEEALRQGYNDNHESTEDIAQAGAPSTSPPALPEQQYTRSLVIARVKEENISWVYEELGSEPKLAIHIYTVDANPGDPAYADNLVPMNKGHEVMVYLTYIIAHYQSLPDVSIFAHAHRMAWHNNDLLDSDMARMISQLSLPAVLRAGYFPLRCHLDPGCPAHLHPADTELDRTMPEQREVAKAWPVLFPDEPIPEVLSSPCCSQFAVSAEALRRIPIRRYEELRRWVLETPLNDVVSGRVFEYVWQKLWTGLDELCPEEHVCYCDGYGICFEGGQGFSDWIQLRASFRDTQPYLELISQLEREGKVSLPPTEYDPRKMEQAMDMGIGAFNKPEKDVVWKNQLLDQARTMVPIDKSFDDWAADYRKQASELRRQLDAGRDDAIERGKDPRVRAMEAGREWKEGDGY